MATSGTVVFNTDRNTLLKAALRLVNAYDPENSAGPTTAQLNGAGEALNMIVKALQSKQIQLWAKRWAVVFPQKDQFVYVLGSPGPAGDHATYSTPLGLGGFVNTTLSADAAATDTTIVVESVSSDSSVGVSAVSIANTYNIGVELDTGYIQWTTVSGAPAGTTVTLAAALTGDASEGNRVYCYQTKLVRPVRVTDGFIRNSSGLNDTPVNPIPRENYNRFGLKSSTGTPTQMYYDQQRVTGHLYTYPAFSNVDQLLFIEMQKPLDDMTSSTDDFDLPQEWFEFLKYRLAVAIAPEYEVPKVKFSELKDLLLLAWELVGTGDQENTSVFMQPNLPVMR